MRKLLIVLLAGGLSGCNDSGSSQEESTASGVADSIGGVLSGSEWVTETTNSGIDGAIHTASRTYDFADRRSQFQVAVSCVADTGVSDLTIDSYVGDTQRPEEGSAFVVESPTVPAGRAKASDGEVTRLSVYFSASTDYSNRLTLKSGNPIATMAIQNAPGYSPVLPILGEGDVNYARLILATLPMTVQVRNGSGDFELEIDRSAELTATLNACGADGEALTSTYLVKAGEAELGLRSETVSIIRDICSSRGEISESIVEDSFRMGSRSDRFLENAKMLGIPLRCEPGP